MWITFRHKSNAFVSAGVLLVKQHKCKNGALFSFYFYSFTLHTNKLGAFVLIVLLFNLICVRWRPGTAAMRPKVVRHKWLCGASRRKWDCDKTQCKRCRLAERKALNDAGLGVVRLQRCVRVESSHPQCRAGLYPPLSCTHINMSLLFA